MIEYLSSIFKLIKKSKKLKAGDFVLLIEDCQYFDNGYILKVIRNDRIDRRYALVICEPYINPSGEYAVIPFNDHYPIEREKLVKIDHIVWGI